MFDSSRFYYDTLRGLDPISDHSAPIYNHSPLLAFSRNVLYRASRSTLLTRFISLNRSSFFRSPKRRIYLKSPRGLLTSARVFAKDKIRPVLQHVMRGVHRKLPRLITRFPVTTSDCVTTLPHKRPNVFRRPRRLEPTTIDINQRRPSPAHIPHTNIYRLAIPSINSELQNRPAACRHVASFESAHPESSAND